MSWIAHSCLQGYQTKTNPVLRSVEVLQEIEGGRKIIIAHEKINVPMYLSDYIKISPLIKLFRYSGALKKFLPMDNFFLTWPTLKSMQSDTTTTVSYLSKESTSFSKLQMSTKSLSHQCRLQSIHIATYVVLTLAKEGIKSIFAAKVMLLLLKAICTTIRRLTESSMISMSS